MEKKNNAGTRGNVSMDGFIRRDSMRARQIGQPSFAAAGGDVRMLGRVSNQGGGSSASFATPAPAVKPAVKRGDLDDSLKAIDGDVKQPNKHDPYRKARRRKITKRIIITIIVLAVLGGIAFALNVLFVSGKVFKGGALAAVLEQSTPLQKDSYGRTNILLFGTSEDDGPDHGGAALTDSIMILSIDQDKKTANMLSIPRDLWVQYDTKCSMGYAGKINATYACALEAKNNDVDAASQAFATKVNEVFGTDIQYYTKVDYTVVRDVVDAVGGVDVDIQGSDPRGILDRNFDWTCNYTCYLVKYPNGVAHLDGTHALALARARNDAGGYGLARGNFDREQNQQKILKAVQAKATSGVLANPIALNNLINSLGNNIKTNFQASEIKTIAELAKSIKSDDIKSLDIAQEDENLVTTGTGPDGSSIVMPVDGLLDYSGLQAYVKAVWSGDTSALEHATVAVYNGSQTAGVATTTSDTLKNAGFNVVTVDDAVKDYTPKYTLYDQSGGKKPATLAKLQKQLGNVSVTSGSPSDITSSADFIVVIGSGTATGSQSSASQ